MKVASVPADPPKTSRNDKLLLNLAGSAFFIMILLGPLLTFGEDSATATQLTGEGSIQRQIGYLLILAASIYAAMRQPQGIRALVLPWPLLGSAKGRGSTTSARPSAAASSTAARRRPPASMWARAPARTASK